MIPSLFIVGKMAPYSLSECWPLGQNCFIFLKLGWVSQALQCWLSAALYGHLTLSLLERAVALSCWTQAAERPIQVVLDLECMPVVSSELTQPT